jgi:hypothetical protein
VPTAASPPSQGACREPVEREPEGVTFSPFARGSQRGSLVPDSHLGPLRRRFPSSFTREQAGVGSALADRLTDRRDASHSSPRPRLFSAAPEEPGHVARGEALRTPGPLIVPLNQPPRNGAEESAAPAGAVLVMRQRQPGATLPLCPWLLAVAPAGAGMPRRSALSSTGRPVCHWR